jgi:polynucleotide 5'-kinase involved in rRNA processing
MKGLSKVYKSSEIFPEPEWEALVEKLFNHKGTIFLMGVISSGKSTLARYLLEKLPTSCITFVQFVRQIC